MSPIVCENCANYVESKKYCYVIDKDFIKVGGAKDGKAGKY